jgi:Leucine-rich repeat (LRR) protein
VRQLERLYLSFNKIREMPDEIGYCQKLVELDFCSNIIENVPIGLAMCINLNLLNLGTLASTDINPLGRNN